MKIQQLCRATRLLAASLLLWGIGTSALAETKTVEKIELCPGDTIIYRGMEITEQGVYRDTMYSIDGSLDSIFVILVNEAHTYKVDTVANWTKGTSHEWRGQTIKADGTYYDYLKTQSGCDSTIVLHASFYPAYRFEEEYTRCASDPAYKWQGEYYTQPDTYEVHYQTIHGQDSVYVLTLNVSPVNETWITETICYGSVYYFNDQPLSNSGEYMAKFVSSKGCDSICHLVLNVLPELSHRDTIYVSDAQLPVQWRGQTISDAGTYFEHHTTTNDCDSDFILVVNIWPTYDRTIDTTVCQSELPIIWQGQKIYEAALYTHFGHTIHGTDSITRLNLKVQDVFRSTMSAQKCEGESFFFRGRELTESGVYYDTIPSVKTGCDSIIKLILSNYPTYHFEEVAELEEGKSIVWNDMTITKAGIYHFDTVSKQTGCDSTFVLTVTDRPAFRDTQDVKVCELDLPLLWYGQTIYANGTYMHYNHTANGTDTILQLNVSITKTKHGKAFAKKCEDDSFFFRGRELTEPGIYYDTIPSLETECDSIVTLTLSNYPTYHFVESMELHRDTSFDWHGQTVQGVGTYHFDTVTINKCDSSYTLTVTRRMAYHIYDTVSICQQDLPYVWFGQQLYNTGSYSHFDYTTEGVDSIHHLDLTVNVTKYAMQYAQKCEGESFFFRGRELTEPGLYNDTLLSRAGCDSIITLSLSNYPTYRFEETAELGNASSILWNGITITYAGTYYKEDTTIYGCDSIHVLYVTKHPSYHFFQDTAVCERDLPLLWQNQQLYKSGTYTSKMKSHFGTDSIYELNLTVHETQISTRYITLCPGETFSLRNQDITRAGVYYDTIPSKSGCDEVIQYIIGIARAHLYETEAVLDQNHSFTWRKHVYTKPGIYEDVEKTSTGCDSIFRLILHEHEAFYIDETATICRHEAPYIFHGKQYFETGTYFDTVPKKYDNDTVYRLHLTVNEDYLFTERVDLCENTVYTFRGLEITEPGVYYDSLLSVTGCDSVYMIVVNRMPSRVTETYVRIPDTELPYEWHGQTLMESGVYTDHQVTATGCDSLFRLNLTVLPTFRFVEEAKICEGGAYEWRGRSYVQSGTYTVHYTTADGMDSIYVLNLTVTPKYETTRMTQLCDGDSFMFFEQLIDEPGIYTETLMTKDGCDSVINLVVNRSANAFNSEYAEMCEGDFYTWRGHDYTEKGTYFDTMKTAYGCDSIFRLTLNIAPTHVTTQHISLCEGEKFLFFGRNIVDPGIYTETLISTSGCDSTIRLIVNRIPSYQFFDTLYLDNHNAPTWHGQVISAAGTYTDAQKTVAGCDSVYTLTAIMQNSYHFETKAAICEGEEFEWRGGKYTVSGTYNETYPTVDGLDSIYTLYLTVYPHFEVTDYRTICEGETILWRGQSISESGVYTDTLLTTHGCDSIYKMVVNVASGFYQSETMNLAVGQQITWHGQKIQAAGTYYDEQKNKQGCDSIYELIVNVYPTYLYEDKATICDNEGGYEWRGMTFTTTGIYYDRFKTAQGMDSIYCLHLTVWPTAMHDETLFLCDGDQLDTHGMTITEPGIYYDSLLTKHGCDSVIRIIVQRAPAYLYMEDGQIPAHGYYSWRNRILTEPGVYYDSLHSVNGCDSIYKLTLHKKPVYYFEEADTVCANYLPYMYHGMALYQTGIYFDSLQTYVGMDSVYRFQLTVLPTAADTIRETICKGETYMFGDEILTQSGIYQNQLVSSVGCDSIVTLILTVSTPFYKTEQTTICEGSQFEWHGKVLDHEGYFYDSSYTSTGCDSIYCIHVTTVEPFFQQDTAVICDKQAPYFWHGQNYYTSGIYQHKYNGRTGCDSIYELNLTVQESYFGEKRIDFCQSDGVSHRGGERFYTSRIILDTMPTFHGCDSIIKFVYVAHPSYRFESVGTINPGGSYLWRGRTLTQAGYYEDQDTTMFGCDSTYVLRLVENLQYAFYDTVRICDSELPYEWHDQLISTPGAHVAPYLTKTGADSIYNLELIIWQTKLTEIKDSMCTGDTYRWGDMELTESGTYIQHFYTQHGCDSTVSLTLNFLPAYGYLEEVTISDKETYEWRGNVYSVPGTYTEYFTTKQGCDSIFTLLLNVLPTFFNTDTVAICQNDEPYFWHGNYYHQTGVFYDSHKTQQGRDSIYCLDLTVYPSFREERRFDICQGDVVTFMGKEYSEPGVYTEQFYTKYGCDSIYTIVINYKPSYKFETNATFCKGESYEWRGKSYTTAGTYTEELKTKDAKNEGCDSIYVLHLTMSEPFYMLEQDTLCDVDAPYMWHNKYIFESGTYFDSLRTEAGCDSVYELRLVVHPSQVNIDTVQICHGDTAYYRDQMLTETTLFTDTTFTEFGCPIVSGVVYNFWPTYHLVEHKTVCEGTTFRWHGKEITYEGLYYDTLSTVHGCDSIFELHLEMNSTVRDGRVVNICPDSLPFTFIYDGDTTILWRDTLMEFYYRTPAGCDSIFTFSLILTDKCSEVDSIPLCKDDSVFIHNKYYKEPGQYSIQFNTDLNNNYPDSIYRFVLYPARSAESYDSVNVCTRELPYQYNDLFLFESGHYDDTLQTTEGCDSVVHLAFVVRPVYFNRVQINLCQDEFFAFRGQEITNPGRYLDTLITRDGCDSVVEYIVNRMPTFFHEEKGFITKGGAYLWHKNGNPIEITHAGVFYDSLRTIQGCDSIYRLILTEKKGFYNLEKRTMCESEAPYVWHGLYIYESGIYFDSLMNIQGADSVYELRLIVNEPMRTSSTIKLCQDDTYNFNGTTITQPGIYEDTLFTSEGCDSIVRLIVNKAPTYTERRQYFLCPGETFMLRDRDITEPGIYEDVLLTIDGCDSIIQYVVNEAEHYFFTDTAFMDSKGTYLWHQQGEERVLTQPGIYYDSCRTVHGCDSVYELVLNCASFYEQQIYSCMGDTVRLNGMTFTQDTAVTSFFHAASGCDSVVQYNVVFEPTYFQQINAHTVDNKPYFFDGEWVHQPGRYYHYYQSQFGCDSTICLDLVVDSTYRVEDSVAFCMDSIPYTHYGKQILHDSLLIDTLRSSHGSDSIVITHLTVHPKIKETTVTLDVCETDSVTIRGRRFGGSMFQTKRSQVLLYDTLLSKATGCDSVVKYIVNVHQTYMIDEYDTFCEGTAYIWRDKHQPGRWLNDTIWIPGRLHHDTIWTPGTYYDSLTTHDHGCDSIFRLHLETATQLYQDQTILVCYDELPYLHPFNNRLYYTDTVFFDTLITAGGCMDIHRTHYKLTNHCSYQETHVCVNEYPTSFDGNRIDSAGDYRFFKMTSTGLDSVIRIKAIDLDTYVTNVTLLEPRCDTAMFDGRVFYARDSQETFIQPIYYKSVLGCDSVVNVQMTIRRSSQPIYKDTVIPDYNIPFRFHNEEYNQSGTYYHHGTNHNGCDSMEVLHLTIVPTSYEAPLNYTICAGSNFANPFDGTTMSIAKSMIIEDKIWNPTALQSIIRTAYVEVEYPFTISNVQAPTQLCAEPTMSFDIDFAHSGTLPNTYTVEFTDPNINFVPRVQTGTLTNNQVPVTISAIGNMINPGDYHMNITFDGVACTQSNTTIQQTLHILYPSSVLESNWDNVVAIVNDKYNAGNWIFTAPYGWLVQDQNGLNKTQIVAPASTSQPYIHSDYLHDGDLVTAYLTRQGTTQPIATCPFVFQSQPYGTNYDVLCAPSRVPKLLPQCTISTHMTGEYAVYDLFGHECQAGSLLGEQTLVTLPATTGCYLVVVHTEDNRLHTQKVMVY